MISTLQGKLFISSIPGAGTVVHVKVPYHPRRCNRLTADDDSSGPTAAAGSASRPPGLTGWGIWGGAGWGE